MTSHRVLLVVLVILAVVLGTLSCPPPSARAEESVQDKGEYRIGAEDVLDIAVWNNTAVSRTVPVRPDGRISLPLLNDVPAAGLTPRELRDVLVQKLADYMPTPEVSVIVREVHSFKVSVIGEIKTPGYYELKSRTTVLDLLAKAGPFTDYAARSRIFVLRPDGGTTMKQIPFNYNKVVSKAAPEENFFLQPGDIIVVP
jgi:polysaccharide biosynthesis/export protein